MQTIMTPRCLKVRFPPRMAFTLMARLTRQDNRTDALRVLKTCEAIYVVPSAVAYLAGLGTALAGARGPFLAVTIGVGLLVGHVLVKARAVLPMLLVVGHAWMFVYGYGILQLAAAFVVWRLGGWPTVKWWVGGWVIAVAVQYVAEFSWMRYVVNRGGLPLWLSEYAFIMAYRLHARRLGADLDVVPDLAEINEGHWESSMYVYSLRAKRAFGRFEFGEDTDEPPAPVGASPVGDEVG